MVNYDDLKNFYKQFSDLCKTEGIREERQNCRNAKFEIQLKY